MLVCKRFHFERGVRHVWKRTKLRGDGEVFHSRFCVITDYLLPPGSEYVQMIAPFGSKRVINLGGLGKTYTRMQMPYEWNYQFQGLLLIAEQAF